MESAVGMGSDISTCRGLQRQNRMQPPTSGSSAATTYPRRVLLDHICKEKSAGSYAKADARTVVTDRTSSDHHIGVSLHLAAPPAVSFVTSYASTSLAAFPPTEPAAPSPPPMATPSSSRSGSNKDPSTGRTTTSCTTLVPPIRGHGCRR